MKFAERVQRVAGRGASAWDTHYQALIDQETDDEVIVLSVGDPDFATPDAITQSAIQALEQGDSHYTPILGRMELRQLIADVFSQQSRVEATADNVAILAGAQNALFSAALCLLEAGDEVISLDPMYLTYEAYLGVSGANIVRVPGLRETGFRPNLDAIASSITEKTKAIAFSNPNNPSGVVINLEELESIAALAKENDLWVISDEVYGALSFDQPHHSIASLDGMFERTVTINSLSKSHAMTGWRLGWMVAPQELVRHVENLALCMLYGLPGFVQAAGITALGTALNERDAMRERYRRRKTVVCEELKNVPNITVLEPEAGMFVLVDVSATSLSAAEFCSQLYATQKVSVLDGQAFGDNIKECIRLSFTSSSETLSQACRRIATFVAGISNGAAL